MSFGWIVCKWSFYLCGIAWKIMMEFGRGGACVPARIALQGRIHRSRPCTNCVCFWYGNAATRTRRPTRAHSSLNTPCTMRVLVGMETPLRGRSGGHTGTAPTVSFGWITHGRLVSFGWIACGGWFRLRRRYGRPLSFPVLPFHPRVNTILLLHATG